MAKHILVILFFAIIPSSILKAQVINDDCRGAISIPNVKKWCSPDGAYTNVNALPSNLSAASCFSGATNDVWFKFIASATDITITLKPGSLSRPEMALYAGGCSTTQGDIECVTNLQTGGVLELYQGGLIPGGEYLLRVQGENGSTGTFGLCFDNYFPPLKPGSDCISASVLCDKSAFIVQSVEGFGIVPDEFKDSDCLGDVVSGVSSESNSTWFRWQCDQPGTLTFTLTPLAPNDDLDFVVYEVTGDFFSCDRKQLRCEAASCFGPTGLRPQASDISEPPNCDRGQDNWLAPINMEAGKVYLLGINNFTAAKNGFRMEFGGTGTFQGPKPDFDLVLDETTCREEQIQIIDKTTDQTSKITDVLWTFGTDATPQSSTTAGDKTISYLKRGEKVVTLTVKNEKGCIVSLTKPIEVLCCGPNHDITLSPGSAEIQIGDSVYIKAQAVLEGDDIFYQWIPFVGIDCQGCDANTIRPFRDRWVTVIATDEFNCTAEDSIFIRVYVNYPIFVPNVFTPNHDGTNDYFTVFGNFIAEEVLELKVFNRWGACVFENHNFKLNDERLGWDGRFKNKFVDAATFAWYAKIRFIDGVDKIFKGSVTVIR